MNRPDNSKKIAIVHDDFIQRGGAEKLVECLLEIYPQADLFTSIISEHWISKLISKNPNLKIQTSFINKIPFKEKLYKSLALLYPIAFWLFNFKNYDLVISSTARFAHGIKTDEKTFHIAYVNSPARMVWEPSKYFSLLLLIILYPFLLILRLWDKFVSKKPDRLVANSKTIQSRIKKYWNRESEVIYPFHDLNKNSETKNDSSDYFLIVSRLEKWKRIDLAIKICSALKQKLVIVGEGRHKNTLVNMANSDYVEFMGRLNDSDLIKTYKSAKALIMTQKEDFGITALESQSFGVPVIAFKSGGALETIIENKTGFFFDEQSEKSLKQAILDFEKIEINPEICIIHANKFTKDEFISRITSLCQ